MIGNPQRRRRLLKIVAIAAVVAGVIALVVWGCGKIGGPAVLVPVNPIEAP